MSEATERHSELARLEYQSLQRRARVDGRPTDELLTLFALEGFLDRLAKSTHLDSFVLKGGVLLAAFETRRPTRDIDMLAIDLANDARTISDLVRAVIETDADDGLAFDGAAMKAEIIQGDAEYSGIRVSLPCTLHTAKISFHVDVSVGDPVWPEPEMIDLPRLLGGTISLKGYPLPMVLAEKIVTAIGRGTVNTRWRDFFDMYSLTGQHEFSAQDVAAALKVVASHRSTPLVPLAQQLNGYAQIAQTRWAAWLRKQRLIDRAPIDFADLLFALYQVTDPLITDTGLTATWTPASREWVLTAG
ncbi:MAG: nucleotidyl transferase AbiEii/AbiGii toxin family protein [Candidatus Nanopelagicales bacterium]